MFHLKHVLLALLSFSSALAASRTSPPSGAVVVRAGTTTSGEFATISDAVASLDDDSTASIFIYPGTYNEQVYIDRSGALTIYGYTEDTSSYTDNEVTISAGQDLVSAGSDDASGTLRIHSDGFAMYNVNVENTYGEGSQAVAVSQYGDQVGFYGCGMYGDQDTLLAEQGAQVYLKGYIEGATDFIFGQHGAAYFGGNILAVTGNGWITASGRTSDDAFSYVFNYNTVILGPDADSDTAGNYHFGRPWGDYAKVIFKNTELQVAPGSGLWSVWETSDPNDSDVFFADYNTTGPGATAITRVSFATELSESEAEDYSVVSAVGSDYADWVDTNYFV